MKRDLRIVSFAPAGTEMVCFLGGRKYLCGISHNCDFPQEALTLPRLTRTFVDDALSSDVINAVVQQRLQEGLPLYEIDVASLGSIKPTLILAQSQCTVCAVDTQQAAKLELPEAEVFGLQANNLDEMLKECEHLANRLIELGGEIDIFDLERLRNCIERLQPYTTHVRPRVLVVEWVAPLIAAGNWTPDLVEKAGGESLFASSGEPSPNIEWAELCQADPDILIIAPCGFDLARSLVEAAPIRTFPGWNDLSAVRQNRVFVSNGNGMFHRCGPRLIDTVKFLGAAIADDETELARFAGSAIRWT